MSTICRWSALACVLVLTLPSPPGVWAQSQPAPAKAPPSGPAGAKPDADRPAPHAADLQALLEGVKQIAAPGVPGPLAVFGEQAFPVVIATVEGGNQAAVVAAGRIGAGRGVAWGHPGYFEAATLAAADTGRLALNAVRWAGGDSPSARPVAVRNQRGLLDYLTRHGVKAQALDGPDWRDRLGTFSVLCLDADLGEKDRPAVVDFVRGGGGLLAVELGWGWLQLHPGKTLAKDHGGNRLLAQAGIVWADGYLERGPSGGFPVGANPAPLCHAGRALDLLAAGPGGKARPSRKDLAQAAWTVTAAVRACPPDDRLLLPRLRTLLADRGDRCLPTPQKPLRASDALDRVLLSLQLEEINHLPPEQVKAHPAAATFPGAVPAGAARVARQVEVQTGVPGWHGTGLYAAPGEVVTVDVPPAAAGKGLALRIGAHSDELWGLGTWERCPAVCREFPLQQPRTRGANAMGGPVYVVVPARSKLGTISVRVAGCVEAPRYVLGQTTAAAWRSQIRSRPAPWAELETSKVILTLPSTAVRTLDDPQDVLRFWDAVMDACAELATIPADRPRPERYVCDVQIEAGYMHSGYPIMTLLDMPAVMVDKACMMTDGHGGVWGLFHEMGHNHQSGDWTFDGTGEVTVNLFTLYVFDKVCHKPPASMRDFSQAGRLKTFQSYRTRGSFETWKSDPFLALAMYVELQQAFGWEPFRQVFAEYRGLPRSQRPRTDDDKRDQWMVRFSRAAGKNLGPFFEAWKVPTSASARQSIAGLPAWMPKGY